MSALILAPVGVLLLFGILLGVQRIWIDANGFESGAESERDPVVPAGCCGGLCRRVEPCGNSETLVDR
jgi:hypothetical protein